MSRIVLDSSVLLAVLNGEPGAERLTPELLSCATCSAVNLAEVHSKLVTRGVTEKDAWTATRYAVEEPEAFTAEHARLTGDLIPATRSLGLSLGDRACLALGIHLGVPVYTADRSWKKLKLPISIHVIR
jgi:ribonuclease VapC